MSKARLIMLDCSEFSIELDRLFRTKYQEYIYLLDMFTLGDFISEYVVSNVNLSTIFDWLGWSDLKEITHIRNELQQYFELNLPIIKKRAIDLCSELTSNTASYTHAVGASIMVHYELDE